MLPFYCCHLQDFYVFVFLFFSDIFQLAIAVLLMNEHKYILLFQISEGSLSSSSDSTQNTSTIADQKIDHSNNEKTGIYLKHQFYISISTFIYIYYFKILFLIFAIKYYIIHVQIFFTNALHRNLHKLIQYRYLILRKLFYRTFPK